MVISMKIIVVSDDTELLELVDKITVMSQNKYSLCNTSHDPLDVLSAICSVNPLLLILDDDFMKPNSVQLLKSLHKINSKTEIIFITSDNSLDLGREVSQLGLRHYDLKPVDAKDLEDAIESVIHLNKKTQNIDH
jgi:response regulator of citrate/malate metabolism